MYRILIKYNSVSQKTYWYDYETEQEDGTVSPFETDDKKLLVEEINKLDKQIGFENIRVVSDISYVVSTKLAENDVDIADPDPDDINTDDTDPNKTEETEETDKTKE